MTFDPVLPPLVLAAAAAALIVLRLLGVRAAAGAGGRAVLRWSTTTVAMLLLLLAAARPVSAATADTDTGHPRPGGANVFLVVDRSADSATVGTPRMSAMRDDIERLVDAHPGARFALITFASRPAVEWPLSDDTWSLQPVVETLTPIPGPSAADTEVNAAAAANVLRYQLIAAGQQYPSAENLVYYLGSGAPESTAPQGTFDTPAVDGGAVLGYGTGRGEATLRDIAGRLGVSYVQRGGGDPLPAAVAPTDSAAAPSEAADSPGRVEYYWVLTLLAGLLLLAEIFLTARDLLRARATRREVLQ
ncbi:VWA domain-containing protein [Mycobacterium sp. 4D054]|uniref:VWA domain-containing protein n=1 Tax=Mycobacterium sp. 4D054 TaxID=3457440 RepID=UPI003FD41821